MKQITTRQAVAGIGLGLAMTFAGWVTIMVGTTGCKRKAQTWVGLDRERVSCVYKRNALEYASFAECVGSGRVYHCVREDSAWQCVDVTARPPALEAPQ